MSIENYPQPVTPYISADFEFRQEVEGDAHRLFWVHRPAQPHGKVTYGSFSYGPDSQLLLPMTRFPMPPFNGSLRTITAHVCGGKGHDRMPAKPPRVEVLSQDERGKWSLLGSASDPSQSVADYEKLHPIVVELPPTDTYNAIVSVRLVPEAEDGSLPGLEFYGFDAVIKDIQNLMPTGVEN